MRTRTCVYRCLVISNKTKKKTTKKEKKKTEKTPLVHRASMYVHVDTCTHVRTYMQYVCACVTMRSSRVYSAVAVYAKVTKSTTKRNHYNWLPSVSPSLPSFRRARVRACVYACVCVYIHTRIRVLAALKYGKLASTRSFSRRIAPCRVHASECTHERKKSLCDVLPGMPRHQIFGTIRCVQTYVQRRNTARETGAAPGNAFC